MLLKDIKTDADRQEYNKEIAQEVRDEREYWADMEAEEIEDEDDPEDDYQWIL